MIERQVRKATKHSSHGFATRLQTDAAEKQQTFKTIRKEQRGQPSLRHTLKEKYIRSAVCQTCRVRRMRVSV